MVQPRTLLDMLTQEAGRQPWAPAILGLGRSTLDYRHLFGQVDAQIRTLADLGIGRGDRIAVVLPNGPEMATCFLSTACAATCAPLNPDYTSREFEFYLSDLHAKALVLPAGSDSPAREVAANLGVAILELDSVKTGHAGEFRLSAAGKADPLEIRSPAAEDVALLLHTSGTTSRPKLVPLTHSNVCASASNVMASLGLMPSDRCLNVMPLFHIHGLVAGLLASLASGGSVACTPGFYVTEFFEWMDALMPTWHTAVPTMHQAILARAEDNLPVIRRTPLRFVRSSSSPLPPQVMAETERVFNVPVIEAYGMTEASHQMASNPLPPDKRKPGSVGRAAGPEVAVIDETGRLLPAGEPGEIVIRGVNVTYGYLNNPDANAKAFVDGWFRTGDLGFLDAEGYLFITGRIKEIINRGGEKIAPREIDEVLLGHPAVAQAVTFALPDARLGEDVAAAVVLVPGAGITPGELRKYAQERLAAFKVPRQVLVVDSIPKGPTGKVQRIGLAAKLGLTGQEAVLEGQREHVSPRTAIEAALAEIWCEVLRLDQAGIYDRFLDLGGDSMLATLLVSRVREAWGVEAPLGEFFDAPTVADQAALVERELASGARDDHGTGADR